MLQLLVETNNCRIILKIVLCLKPAVLQCFNKVSSCACILLLSATLLSCAVVHTSDHDVLFIDSQLKCKEQVKKVAIWEVMHYHPQ